MQLESALNSLSQKQPPRVGFLRKNGQDCEHPKKAQFDIYEFDIYSMKLCKKIDSHATNLTTKKSFHENQSYSRKLIKT